MRIILVLLSLLLSLDFSTQIVAQDSVLKHLQVLTETEGFRTEKDTATLNKAADCIQTEFEKYAEEVNTQDFTIAHKGYKNVIASFGIEHSKRLTIGAHYDVCGNQPGADDNASGIAGLLELARLLQNEKPNLRIDLVAYTLEEPPFFNSKNMGSYKHAEYLKENNIEVEGMICLEMIGYFDSAKKSQSYPVGLLSLFYGSKADYITLVSTFGNGKFSRKYIRKFKKTSRIRDKKFKAPKWVEGIDFSDHKNYWEMGYSAIMITDTSFYRNFNYHLKSDTIETLDIPKMCLVIESVFNSLGEYLD